MHAEELNGVFKYVEDLLGRGKQVGLLYQIPGGELAYV
jgi:hypothetical protein